MLRRLLKVTKNQRVMIFGARGVGKSTWIREQFNHDNSLWLDLLNQDTEERLSGCGSSSD